MDSHSKVELSNCAIAYRNDKIWFFQSETIMDWVFGCSIDPDFERATFSFSVRTKNTTENIRFRVQNFHR